MSNVHKRGEDTFELQPQKSEVIHSLNPELMHQNVDHGEEMSRSPSTERPPLKGIQFVLLFIAILLACFVMGYDSSCIATLLPIITEQFDALQDIGWYIVAYILAQSATMLVYGQLYCFFSMKIMFLISLFLFLGGAILTAAAPTSLALIMGRTLNGLGAAGALAATNIILAHTTSLERRPMFFAIAGTVETTSLAFGPLLSGALAHVSSWRVAFWFNVPIVALIIVIVLFFVSHLRQPENKNVSTRDALRRIDWIGFGINIPMTLCLVLALQWAGITFAWSSWRIILLLTLAAVLTAAFLIVQHVKGDNSMVPLMMLRQRTVAFASLITFCNYAHLAVLAYYLPLYFQAIRGANTVESGIMYLPSAVAFGIAAMLGGHVMTWLGYYTPVLLCGSVIMSIGAGLITTYTIDTSEAKWISYQIIYGVGVGLAYQPPMIAVQAVLEEAVVSKALVLLSFTQQLGGIIILSIAQNVCLARLTRNFAQLIPDLTSDTILNSGALEIVDLVPVVDREAALLAYNDALVQVFYIALALACLVVLSTGGLEWRSIRKQTAS